MSGVSFEEHGYDAVPRTTILKPQSFLTKLMISMGLAKDDRGAQHAMVAIIILSVLATAGILLLTLVEETRNTETEPPTIPGVF